MTNQSIIERIIELKDSLPKKQKQLCTYIVHNATEAGMMTVAELAKHAKVGTTTVVRLVQDLGYDSYTAFKRDVMSASMQKGSSSYGNRAHTIFLRSQDVENNTLAYIVSDFGQVATGMLTKSNVQQFEKAVDILLQASRINVLGLRSSRAAAFYFEYAVSLTDPKIRQLSNEVDFLFDRLMSITPDEVLLVISQWPCTHKTIEAANVCHKRGIPIVLLTNTRINPIAPLAAAMIDTDSVSSSSDILPVMTVLEAISYEMAKRTAPRSTQRLEELEEMLRENGLIIWDSK